MAITSYKQATEQAQACINDMVAGVLRKKQGRTEITAGQALIDIAKAADAEALEFLQAIVDDPTSSAVKKRVAQDQIWEHNTLKADAIAEAAATV